MNYLTKHLFAGYHVKAIENQKDKVLGQGAHGTVYSMKGNFDLCIKESNKQGVSRKWRNEFDIIKNIFNQISTYDNVHLNDYVRIACPLQFIETVAQCYMLIPRIFRADNDKSNNNAIHALLGFKNHHKIFENRGESYGLEEIEKFYNNTEIFKKVIYELGVVIALIQYVAKNDASDIEIIFGHEYSDELTEQCQNRLYVIDFDMSSTYEKADFEWLAQCLETVRYFPIRSKTNTRIQAVFEEFKKGYQSIAGEEFTNNVFKHYDLYNPEFSSNANNYFLRL